MTTQKFKWQGIVSKYAYPETWRSVWQVFNSAIPFFVMWYLMYRSLEIGYWLTLILAVLAGGFMTRMFIIFHDCCHGSFLRSMKANDRLGLVLGVLVFTPFYQWKHSHAIHHATAADLDRRGIGDVYTMTVEEYLAAPWYTRQSWTELANDDHYLRIRYWDCSENQNNDIIIRDDGTSQFPDFDFVEDDAAVSSDEAIRGR